MRLTIIEPHADDAFISLGGHIESLWKDYEILIVTVYCDATRSKEAKQYAEQIGCRNVCLFAEGHRDMKETGPSVIISELIEFLKSSGGSLGDVIGPLGLQHPDHRSVYVTLQSEGNLSRVYCDIPYYTKLRNQTEMSDKVLGRSMQSVFTPGKRKWRYRELFKSQAKFFHFNPLQDLRTPEILLSANKSPL